NKAEGDLFVSIHADAWNTTQPRGTTAYFLGLHQSDRSLEIMKHENEVFNNGKSEVIELTPDDLLIYELAHSGYIATSERIATMIDDQFKNRAGRKSRGV